MHLFDGKGWLYQNGSSRIADTVPTTITQAEIKVGNWDTGGHQFQGNIPEVLLFASMVGSADIKRITASHASYWGTSAGRVQDASIPAQTSDTAPTGYNVTYSDQRDTVDYNGFHAFDQSNLSEWATNVPAANVTRQFPSALTATAYSIEFSRSLNVNTAPKTWNFQGSNNGSTWTTLDSPAAQTGWVNGERRIFSIAGGSQAPYTYYRLDVLTNNGSSLTALAEIEIITS
jgi:hypothetical protein